MTDELEQEWSDSAEPLADAEWALFDTPAPDHAAVEWKLDFLATHDGFDADRAARIIADVKFLRAECEA